MSEAYRSSCRPKISQQLSVDISVECRSRYRPKIDSKVGRYVERHISIDILVDMSTDTSWPIYRSSIGRYVDRYISTYRKNYSAPRAPGRSGRLLEVAFLVRKQLSKYTHTNQSFTSVDAKASEASKSLPDIRNQTPPLAIILDNEISKVDKFWFHPVSSRGIVMPLLSNVQKPRVMIKFQCLYLRKLSHVFFQFLQLL